MRVRTLGSVLAIFLLGVTGASAQQAATDFGNDDHVAAIKQSLQQSAAALHHYKWIETTVISIKGEQKSQTEKSCYYGADGTLEKIPIGQPESGGKKPRGLRGRIAEKKKADLTESMQEATALVKEYVPPDATKIQAAKDAGRLSIVPPDDKGNVTIKITEYLKKGDSLALEVNAATNQLLGLTVSSYTDSAKDAVGLKVGFATFADGIVYAKTTELDVASENLAVVVTNSGYEKQGG